MALTATEIINQIEKELEILKKEYTQFFGGLVKIEPYELKDAMLLKLKRLRAMNLTRTEERFRATNLQAKVQSQIKLWERQLERKFSGNEQRNRPMSLVKPKEKPKRKEVPERKPILINDPKAQRDQVVELYDEYMKLNLLLGARKMVDFGKFQNFISSQTTKIQKAKKVSDVQYQISVQDQKVVIKSKSVKNKK